MANSKLKPRHGKTIVPWATFSTEVCPKAGQKDEGISGKPRVPNGHCIWMGMTGDSWPAFCVNGCNRVSTDVPPEETDDC